MRYIVLALVLCFALAPAPAAAANRVVKHKVKRAKVKKIKRHAVHHARSN
jgi:hypothetical protein